MYSQGGDACAEASLDGDHGHCPAEDQPWAKKPEKSLRTLPEDTGPAHARSLQGGGHWFSLPGAGPWLCPMEGGSWAHPGSKGRRAGQDPLAGRALTACLGKEGGTSPGVPHSYYSVPQRHEHGSQLRHRHVGGVAPGLPQGRMTLVLQGRGTWRSPAGLVQTWGERQH